MESYAAIHMCLVHLAEVKPFTKNLAGKSAPLIWQPHYRRIVVNTDIRVKTRFFWLVGGRFIVIHWTSDYLCKPNFKQYCIAKLCN